MIQKTIGGIVVYCSDPRPEKANLWKYIKQVLIPHDQRFTPVGMLGAPVALARPTDFPVKFAAVMEDISFALNNFAEERFIVVTHDCGIYERLAPRQFVIQCKKDDANQAAAFLRERFPGKPVSAYFMHKGPQFDQLS